MSDDKIRVRVFHDTYGCETGCCGHVVEIVFPNGETARPFDFTHPRVRDDVKTWARQFAEEYIRDHWSECADTIDWDSMVVEASDE